MPVPAHLSDRASSAVTVLRARTSWMEAIDTRSSKGLQPCGASQQFSQDSGIYTEGGDASIFFKVVKGIVRTCKFLNDGRRQINAFHVQGEIFGFELGVAYTLSAEAVSDCIITPFRRGSCETTTAEDVPKQLFSHVLQNMARAQEHVLLLSRRSAIEKLAAFLVYWAKLSPTGCVACLEMTRQDIADYLGLTIETVSRTFSQLERDALIEISAARKIRLKDLTTLQQLYD